MDLLYENSKKQKDDAFHSFYRNNCDDAIENWIIIFEYQDKDYFN